jgi:predicted site-specific integrase-resolvase
MKEDTQKEVMMDWTEILGLESAKMEGYHLHLFREVGKIFTEQIHPSDL